MQDNHLFEYAVIRVVPRVEREEFLNAGVIVYCKDLRFLKTLINYDDSRWLSCCPKMDTEELKSHLKGFENISLGIADAGPIARLEPALRFRWLTAARSTILQSSKVHSGFCVDADVELRKLFQQLVM